MSGKPAIVDEQINRWCSGWGGACDEGQRRAAKLDISKSLPAPSRSLRPEHPELGPGVI